MRLEIAALLSFIASGFVLFKFKSFFETAMGWAAAGVSTFLSLFLLEQVMTHGSPGQDRGTFITLFLWMCLSGFTFLGSMGLTSVKVAREEDEKNTEQSQEMTYDELVEKTKYFERAVRGNGIFVSVSVVVAAFVTTRIVGGAPVDNNLRALLAAAVLGFCINSLSLWRCAAKKDIYSKRLRVKDIARKETHEEEIKRISQEKSEAEARLEEVRTRERADRVLREATIQNKIKSFSATDGTGKERRCVVIEIDWIGEEEHKPELHLYRNRGDICETADALRSAKGRSHLYFVKKVGKTMQYVDPEVDENRVYNYYAVIEAQPDGIPLKHVLAFECVPHLVRFSESFEELADRKISRAKKEAALSALTPKAETPLGDLAESLLSDLIKGNKTIDEVEQRVEAIIEGMADTDEDEKTIYKETVMTKVMAEFDKRARK
jgi:hypothetical protein